MVLQEFSVANEKIERGPGVQLGIFYGYFIVTAAFCKEEGHILNINY